MITKSKLLIVTLVSVLALAALSAGIAFAQSPTPTPNTGFGPGWMMGGNGQPGYGRMGGGRMLGGYAQNSGDNSWMGAMRQWMASSGGMHTVVWNAVAGKLGMTSAELTTAVNGGKTLAQVAADKGISRTDLVSALAAAHKDSLAQAVTAGALTQAQADGMLTQMAGRYEWMLDNSAQGGMMGAGAGAGFGRGGMMGGAGGCGGNWNGSSATPQPKP